MPGRGPFDINKLFEQIFNDQDTVLDLVGLFDAKLKEYDLSKRREPGIRNLTLLQV